MIVVFGSTLYGKVQAVPGVCHVATRFLHLFFVPLFPTGSWLVIDKRLRAEASAEAIKLPAMHWGSVALGWLRFFLVVALFVLTVIAATKISLDRPWSQTTLIIVAAVSCAAALVGSYRLVPARPQSIEALRSVSGIPGVVLARASERLGATQ